MNNISTNPKIGISGWRRILAINLEVDKN